MWSFRASGSWPPPPYSYNGLFERGITDLSGTSPDSLNYTLATTLGSMPPSLVHAVGLLKITHHTVNAPTGRSVVSKLMDIPSASLTNSEVPLCLRNKTSTPPWSWKSNIGVEFPISSPVTRRTGQTRIYRNYVRRTILESLLNGGVCTSFLIMCILIIRFM